MYNLRTAKEAKDSLAKEHGVSKGVKDLLDEVNTKIEQTIANFQSHFTMYVSADDYKKDAVEKNGDITEFKRILESYGYHVSVSPALDEHQNLLHSIYVSW
ncbi:gp0.31 [Bacillus phage SPO1]|uniref:Gp0.31 n=1 Tax=Bacillus phage SP01 TaxID=2884427 RepID=B6V2X2_BPSP1|nr:gp0.31 [Bacillus phage SPO1]ACI90940.1 gp0.31 [Bacillus phage SPO1]